MRYLVMSDIHANLSALDAVLADASAYDAVVCLGDLVGYGPDPNECIDKVRELPCTSLAGNHDWAVLGKLNLNNFNHNARRANAWTQTVLAPESREYLRGLPPQAELDGITIVHASPREPIWEYVLDTRVALANFDHFSTPLCLLGHSHVPLLFELNEERGHCSGSVLDPFRKVALNSPSAMLNPGSVGQPRDGDPRASYAILDTDELTWETHRVAYAIKEVQARMRGHNLPSSLVDRLSMGY